MTKTGALHCIIVVTCPAFPTLENGVIIYYGTEVNGQYPYLTGVIFLCDYPLALSGPETDFCLSTSNWQHQPRTCNQGNVIILI